MASNPLANLRDIHLPPPVSFWPPAPGWIILTVIVCAIVIGSFLYYRHRKQHLAQTIALQELALLKLQLTQNAELATILGKLSSLLRRAALAKFPRAKVAGLEGQAWLEFLNQQGQTQFFTTEIGKSLIFAPYQRHPVVKIEPLFVNIELWIKKCL